MHAQPAIGFGLACEEALSRVTLRARNAAPEFQRGSPTCTWRDVVEDVRRLLEKAAPDIVVCPHPLVDGHHDHVFTTVAVAEAVRSLPPRNRLFLLYVVHRRDAPLYPFGPADTLVSLPPWTEDEWLADSVYSHPLAPDLQRAKFFAIEATHDLREYQGGAPRTVRQALVTARAEVAALVAGTGLPAASFLRRAARPNEIYWVVSEKSLAELVERALARV
jgi:LmbE family N-acetylglucosaminyl deacetylase